MIFTHACIPLSGIHLRHPSRLDLRCFDGYEIASILHMLSLMSAIPRCEGDDWHHRKRILITRRPTDCQSAF